MSASNALQPAVRRLLRPSRLQNTPPAFLLPAVLSPKQHASPFSSTTSSLFPRDNNRERGVSTQRRSGLRQPVSVSKTPLPKPVLNPDKHAAIEVDEDHGLWEFFHNKDKPMNTPEEDYAHGRSWCVEELRAKSWEDLHALWWVCCKERNRISTEAAERIRLKAGYGQYESSRRLVAVKLTQRNIKHVLTERFYSWRDAQDMAKNDPEVNLSGSGPAYMPAEFVEEDLPEDEMDPALDVGDHSSESLQIESGTKLENRPPTSL